MYQQLCLIILSIFCLMACSNVVKQEQTENEQSKSESKTKVAEPETTTNSVVEIDTIDPLAGLKHWEPTWEPGTYFTKNFPEHAWMDTLTFEDLFVNRWIITTFNGRFNEETNQYFRYSGKFTDQFKEMLPDVPKDSFMLYKAHWFGVNDDFEF